MFCVVESRRSGAFAECGRKSLPFALAMMHLAMHDAISAAKPRYASYSEGERDGAAHPAVAAVSAAHDVLAELRL
jgi:hypothetical protein